MRVHLAEQARSELFEIGEWIERDSPTRAASFVEELYDACMRLGDMPNAFARIRSRPESGIRMRVYGNYLISYIVGTRVDVLHIVHGARNYEEILFPPKP